MSATKTEYKAFVGGEWVDSASGETMDVINPATGEVVASVPRCSGEDVDRAVAAAATVLPEWLDQTPLSLLRFVQLAKEVIPAGVLQVVTGDGVPVGERLVSHPDVRLVSLTGDVATGKAIARNAADTLKRVHLELGGKAPMVVFDDADPAAVAAGIRLAGFWYSGQDCTAGSRVIAGRKIDGSVLDAIVRQI